MRVYVTQCRTRSRNCPLFPLFAPGSSPMEPSRGGVLRPSRHYRRCTVGPCLAAGEQWLKSAGRLAVALGGARRSAHAHCAGRAARGAREPTGTRGPRGPHARGRGRARADLELGRRASTMGASGSVRGVCCARVAGRAGRQLSGWPALRRQPADEQTSGREHGRRAGRQPQRRPTFSLAAHHRPQWPQAPPTSIRHTAHTHPGTLAGHTLTVSQCLCVSSLGHNEPTC